jgi:transcriptional regulator with XRE-family HTH domain
MSRDMGDTRGKRSVFSSAQNEVLRAALLELKKRKGLSQTELGELLGVKQQNAGRLLREDATGFSYDSATRLVRKLGFSGVDSFFKAKKVALPSQPPSRPDAA